MDIIICLEKEIEKLQGLIKRIHPWPSTKRNKRRKFLIKKYKGLIKFLVEIERE